MINLFASTEKLKHRGPDCGLTYTDDRVGLGHRRLSIIDLSSGANQPMSDPSGRYTIVFNGEIFNFKSLREDLLSKGVELKTNSDTEVLLHLYITYNTDCLVKLHGFFGFAIYDKQEQSLFIARDRIGIKPLVFYYDEDKFVFASELEALYAFNLPLELDYVSAFQYFQFNYIPAPHTIYKNVNKLMQGHYMMVKKGSVETTKYYEVINNENPTLTYTDAKKELIHRLEAAVEERMISDVPLGAFLSGGIDSSVITAIASSQTKNLNTFSIGYKDEPHFDETKYAKLVAEKYKTNHTTFTLTNDDIFDNIFEMLDFFGEPFADSSTLPLYILTKETKKKVTVALSGDGADEIFGGYHKYMGEFKARQGGFLANALKMGLPLLSKLPQSRNSKLTNTFRRINRFAQSMTLEPAERYLFLSSVTSQQQVLELLSPEFIEKIDFDEYNRRTNILTKFIKNESFNEVLISDVNLVLTNDMLTKVDSISMANSLEVRVPFLDHRVVNFAFTLPTNYKIDGNMKKKVLQDAARHLLPTELYNRPKHGFDVPLMKGYKNELKSWIHGKMLDDTFVKNQEIFSPEYISNLKNTLIHSNSFDQNHVWAILVFQNWWKKHN